MKHGKLSGLALGLALFVSAATAHATTWVIQAKVTKVALMEKANAGGSAKVLEISFENSGSVCGSTVTIATVGSTESATFFADWIKMAQAALLSGRELRLQTNNASGTCKTEYLELWN